MNRISAPGSQASKLFNRFVWPLLLVVGFVTAARAGAPLAAVVMLGVAAVIFSAFLWFFFTDIADEVDDLGDRLRVRRGKVVEDILLDNVNSVAMSFSSRPDRLILRLRRPSAEFGDRVVFIPRSNPGLNPLVGNEIEADLRNRVARRAHHYRSAQ